MHLNDGLLRAYLDGELPGAETARVEAHLESCARCQARLAETHGRVERTAGWLGFLSSQAEEARKPLAEPAALQRLHTRLNEQKEIPMLNRFLAPRLRPIWAAVLVVAILGVTLSIPQGRAWAGQFLGLFRVQQVTVLPIDPTGLSALTGDSSFGQQVSQLLSSSVTAEKKPGDPQPAADAAQASQLAGFTVRLPAEASGDPALLVTPSSAFKFKVDRQRAQALLDSAGRKDLVLPESLDGADIAVNIPSGVSASYGDCPKPTQDEAELKGSMGRRYPDCVMLAEIPSPTVTTPPNVDLQQLAEIGLEFTGMSTDQAQAFSRSVDWTSSLVIPIPKNAAVYKEVTVDGVKGQLIQRPPDDAPQYALVWVKDGVIYAISGLGSDVSQALAMANSMR